MNHTVSQTDLLILPWIFCTGIDDVWSDIAVNAVASDVENFI